MYRYLAYGLGVYSEFQLFDLPVQEVKHDVTIRRAGIDTGLPGEKTSDPYLKLTPQEALYSMAGVGKFHVINGQEITVDPDPNANMNLVQRYLIGVAMALLLHQRGRVVLHASAVSVNGAGIAFLGTSGAGKSSMAAAFMAKGYDLLVDDVTAIDVRDGVPWVYPGFPYFKLSYEAMGAINTMPDQMQFIDYLEGKLSFRIVRRNSCKQVPLEKIYILLPGEQIRFDPYSLQQVLIELIRYSIPSSMVKLNHVTHFERCVELVNCVNVCGLRRPESLAQLSRIVEMVEENISLSDQPVKQE